MRRSLHWKDGVSPSGLHSVMREALLICDDVYHHYNKEIVVTCTVDGDHGPDSLHPWGFALDIRTRYFTDDAKKRVLIDLKARFNRTNFQIVSESTHFHIEFDPDSWKDIIYLIRR